MLNRLRLLKNRANERFALKKYPTSECFHSWESCWPDSIEKCQVSKTISNLCCEDICWSISLRDYWLLVFVKYDTFVFCMRSSLCWNRSIFWHHLLPNVSAHISKKPRELCQQCWVSSVTIRHLSLASFSTSLPHVALLALSTSVHSHIFGYTVLLLADLLQIGREKSSRKAHEYVLCPTNKSSYCLEWC